jgi:hypothetical protein
LKKIGEQGRCCTSLENTHAQRTRCSSQQQ